MPSLPGSLTCIDLSVDSVMEQCPGDLAVDPVDSIVQIT